MADYRRDYARWIAPTFGRRRVTTIAESEVQRWVDAMRDGALPGRRPASPKSIADRHALLHGIFARGVQLKHLPANPCTGTDLPEKQKGLPKGLRPAEWQALHAALRDISPAAGDLAAALLATGWRWSEVTALAVGQVEDTGAAVHVSMDRVVRRNAACQHVIVTEGKGQASVRRIRVDDETAAMLREHTRGKQPGELVFTTPPPPGGRGRGGGGQWHYSNFRTRFWDPAVRAANLSRSPTPQWLRHTHVVWMAMAGAKLPELQSRIGHASITTTINVYGRMLSDVDEAALGGFAAMRAAGPAVMPTVVEGSVAAAALEAAPD